MTQTIDILKQLIAIPSYVDSDHNESELIDFIVTFLRRNPQLKIEEQLVEGKRRNLIVSDGSNPKVILFGHMDTVPPKKQDRDPLVPYESENKIFGLGSVDMKSGLAVMLNIALNSHRNGVCYVFSVDEEFDFKGANKLKEITNLKPEMIINLEPTDNKILNGCRGVTELSFNLIGKASHAGRKNLGINAIEKAIEIYQHLQENVSSLDSADAKSTVNLAYLHGGVLESVSQDGPVIRGTGNVVPDFAKVILEIRLASSKITQEYITETISNKSNELGIKIEDLTFKFYLGSMYTPREDLKDLEQSIQDVGLEPVYSDINSSGYFELQMLQEKWGGKCIVYGSGPSEMSHAANEFVSISSINQTELVVEALISKVLR